MPPPHFTLTLMTADPSHAAAADAAGVDRIGVDFEVKGKVERQTSRPSWIAGHTLEDLRAVGGVLRRADLFVRIHPFELGGREELEQALAAGAQVVMLPMFTTAAQALAFVEAVDGRAKPVLLLETVGAAESVAELVASPLSFEVHLGLNDLGISRGHTSPFAMLLDPLLEQIAAPIRASGRTLAVGRLARADDASLPIPSDLICALTARLGATGSFLSQYFLRGIDGADAPGLATHVARLRRMLAGWQAMPRADQDRAMDELGAAVEALSRRP